MACPSSSSSSSSSSSTHHARSASYPLATNPIFVNIDHQLNQLRESEAASTSPMHTITIGLTGVVGLYKCVDDALTYLPLLPHHCTNTHLERLVNGSLRLVDICNDSREVLGRLRDTLGELKSPYEKVLEVSKYFTLRKEVARRARELALRLREAEGEVISGNRELSLEESELTRVFRCVNIINISVIESLLKLLSSKPAKSRRLSRISKMISGRSKEAEESELRGLDVVLHRVFMKQGGEPEEMVCAQKRLQGLDDSLREIDNGLSCISSQLAKTRASLLKHSLLH